MSGSLNSLLGEQQILQANGMLGRSVDCRLILETTVSGVVDAVDFRRVKPRLIVNGAAYSLYLCAEHHACTGNRGITNRNEAT